MEHVLRVAAVARPRFDVAVVRLARSPWTWSWLLVASVPLCRWAFDRIEVQGSSMEPTFAPGDRLLLVRRVRRVHLGDVVVLEDPRGSGRRLVKRVASVLGDEVAVLGDNPAASTDSRTFGSVPLASIHHLVVRRYGTGARP
jgi:nickel-type superoxide dismutase maturation protease